MNLALWIVQCLLAALFMMTGMVKLVSPPGPLPMLSPALVTFIGICEVAGATGLILPAATRIQPRLTVWAAIGLGMIMILATLFHLSRAEYREIIGTVAILACAVFVAYGRGVRRPIAAR